MQTQYSHRISDAPADEQYSTRAQGKRKPGTIPAAVRAMLFESAAYLCQYCGYPADEIDHIVPWSYGGSDHVDNLAVCCRLCNSLATNMVFDDFNDKRQFILMRLDTPLYRRRRKLSICTHCKTLYRPKHRGSTAFYCAACMKENEW
jgi:hypothetical protein